MDKPTTWTPCRELELANTGDATPNANPEAFRVQWKNMLAARILEALPHPTALNNPQHYNRNQLTSDLVKIVADVVGQADEVLHELSEKLDRVRATNDELRKQCDTMIAQYDELSRIYDERTTMHTVTAIELERARDHAQDLEIKLAGMELRATTAEAAERKLREGN